VVSIARIFFHIHMYLIYHPERILQRKTMIGSSLEKEIDETHRRA
jgi:hypothetical protein